MPGATGGNQRSILFRVQAIAGGGSAQDARLFSESYEHLARSLYPHVRGHHHDIQTAVRGQIAFEGFCLLVIAAGCES